MTLIEFLLFTIHLGVGAILGYLLAGFPGMIVGMGAGLVALWFIPRFLNPYPADWPTCACGVKERSEFAVEQDRVHGFVLKCKGCGAIHEMRKRATWSRIRTDGTKELLTTRTFRGRWKPAKPVSGQQDSADHDTSV